MADLGSKNDDEIQFIDLGKEQEQPRAYSSWDDVASTNEISAVDIIATPREDDNVKIRDYAYSEDDPRHRGKIIVPSPRQRMNDWDSDEELRYGTYGEFSRVDSEDNSDDDPDLSGPDLVTTLGGQVSLKGLDIDFDVLPALGKHIVDLIRGEEGIEPTSELRFHCAKALYEFAKMTDSEMTVAEGDYIFVVRIEKSEEEDIVDGRTEDPPPKNGEEDQPNSEAGGPVSKLNESDGSQALSDRWCSIDEVPEALAKSKEKQSLQIVTEPDREEFGAQIRQLIQYQKLYGTGWVTGVKLRVKGKGKAADWGEEVTGKVKITMQDIGLLPDNYLEHL